MRALLALVASAGIASADVNADVEKVVRANLAAIAADDVEKYGNTTSDKLVVFPDGKSQFSKGLVHDVYGPKAKKVAHEIEKVHVVVFAPKKLAWFHASLVATFTAGTQKVTQPMRVVGVVIDDGPPVGWRIEAAMYARAISDKDLYARAADATRGKATTSGDAAAKVVAAWFDGGSIANDRSKNVAVIVNGTAPVELGNGAFAVKLVKAWDNLKMWATAVEATSFANGEIAFVRADVKIPVKERASSMVLGAVLVKENGQWRWVTLCFTPGG